MPVCSECARNVNNKYPGIRCFKCARLFHTGCADGATELSKISDLSNIAWICLSCRPNVVHDHSTAANSDLDIEPSSIKQLSRSIKALKMELLSAIDVKFDSVLKSVNFCCQKISDFETNLKLFNEKIKDLESIRNENLQLKSQVTNLNHRLNEIEQYSRINNVIIQNIPEKSNENINDLVINIAKSINVDIKCQDIDAAHRVQQVNKNIKKPKNIIVKFVSRGCKESFMKGVKVNNVNTKLLGLDENETKIFVNDHLTKFNSELFKLARDGLRLKNYKYIWTKNNKIFARKTDTSRFVTITSEDDLRRLN